MVYLTILDSGYLKPTNEGTQLTTGYRANSGSAITLRNTDFAPSSSCNLDDSPVLGSSDVSQVNVGSIENMKFSLTIHLDLSVSADQALVYPLVQLTRTVGYKYLYYPSTGTDAAKQLVYSLANNHVFTAGEVTAFSLSAAYRHIHVFFNNIQFKHSGINKNIVVATLTGIVTKSETSSI